MKKSLPYKSIALGMMLTFSTIHSASAFSFNFSAFEEKNSTVEKFVGALFQGNNRLGAALIGEVTSISTTTGSMNLLSKQKNYTIGISPVETKVRKFGIPSTLEEVKAGDKVSVVSSVLKDETIKLKAKIISILSQENQSKYIGIEATSTEIMASSTSATTTSVSATTTVIVSVSAVK